MDTYNPLNNPFNKQMIEVINWEKKHNKKALWLGGWDINQPDKYSGINLFPKQEGKYCPYVNISDMQKAKQEVVNLLSKSIKINHNPIKIENVTLFPSVSLSTFSCLNILKEAFKLRNLLITTPTYYSSLMIANHLKINVKSLILDTNLFNLKRENTNLDEKGLGLLLTNPPYGVGNTYPHSNLQHFLNTISDNTPVILDEALYGLDWNINFPWKPISLPMRGVLIRSLNKIFLVNGSKSTLIIANQEIIKMIENFAEIIIGTVSYSLESNSIDYISKLSSWKNKLPGYYEIVEWKRRFTKNLQDNYNLLKSEFEKLSFTLHLPNTGYYSIASKQFNSQKHIDILSILNKTGVVVTQVPSSFFNNTNTLFLKINLTIPAEDIKNKVIPALNYLNKKYL